MTDTFRDDEPKQKSSGCAKWGVGCGIIAILLVAVTAYGIYNIKSLMLWGASKGAIIVMEAMIDESLKLPEDEREAVMRPVRKFAQRVADGEIDPEVALETVTGLVTSNEAVAVITRSFEHRYLTPEIFPDGEHEVQALTANRFAHGAVAGVISKQTLKSLADVAVEEYTDEYGEKQYRIREPLKEEDIRKALTIMEAAVAEAGITDTYRPLDLEALVEQALQRAHHEALTGESSEQPIDESPPEEESTAPAL